MCAWSATNTESIYWASSRDRIHYSMQSLMWNRVNYVVEFVSTKTSKFFIQISRSKLLHDVICTALYRCYFCKCWTLPEKCASVWVYECFLFILNRTTGYCWPTTIIHHQMLDFRPLLPLLLLFFFFFFLFFHSRRCRIFYVNYFC